MKKKVKIDCNECELVSIVVFSYGTVECCPFCGAEVNSIDDDYDEEDQEDSY